MNPNYVCLQCGSTHGEPAPEGTENWYWRIVQHGRVGPFCKVACSKEFTLEQEQFSLSEWEKLAKIKQDSGYL